mmetsp:Transcript_58457/g.94421  ORF Transcript_58457/g.94421 Transcript_58457/m.94421 type:complete len:295 (-) Transcript_58457:844-1728(-)
MLARFVLAQHQPHTLVITLLRKLGRPLGAGRRTARGKGAAVRGTAVGDDGSVGGGGHVAHVHVCFCYAACAGAVAENAARVRDLRRELRRELLRRARIGVVREDVQIHNNALSTLQAHKLHSTRVSADGVGHILFELHVEILQAIWGGNQRVIVLVQRDRHPHRLRQQRFLRHVGCGGRGAWCWRVILQRVARRLRGLSFALLAQHVCYVLGVAAQQIDAHARPVGLFKGEIHHRPLRPGNKIGKELRGDSARNIERVNVRQQIPTLDLAAMCRSLSGLETFDYVAAVRALFEY